MSATFPANKPSMVCFTEWVISGFPHFFWVSYVFILQHVVFQGNKTGCAATKNHSHHETPKSPWKFEGLSDSWSPQVVIQIVWQKNLRWELYIFDIWDFILLEQNNSKLACVLLSQDPNMSVYHMLYVKCYVSVCVCLFDRWGVSNVLPIRYAQPLVSWTPSSVQASLSFWLWFHGLGSLEMFLQNGWWWWWCLSVMIMMMMMMMISHQEALGNL